MKIAVMVHGFLTIPRPLDMIYAPIDVAVLTAEGLAKKGHTIDFFAPTGSVLKYANVETLGVGHLASSHEGFQKIVENKAMLMHQVPAAWDQIFANEMFERASKGEYDVLHFHHPEAALLLAKRYPEIPVVYTQHDPVFDWFKDMYELYATDNQYFISISNNQRLDAPDLPYFKTVYNGVNTEKFTFNKESEDYLLVISRIIPEKGIKEAIDIAKSTKKRLIIIGQVYPEHQGYFNEKIRPHIDGNQIQYLGYVKQEKLAEYYQNAKAFLMPVQWREPFGMTMIEAMACGTPVIGLKKGSIPEVVKHGTTGFVVNTISEMIDAVNKVDTLDRATCRAYIEKHFSAERLVADHEKLYEEIIATHSRKNRKPTKVALSRSRKK